VTFKGSGIFDKTSFKGDAWFDGATFQSHAWFGGATFQGDTEGVARAWVLRLDDPRLWRAWPGEYTVRRDPSDPTRGLLVPAERLEKEPAPAVPPSDLTGR
jgi:hypothetical protein